MPLPAGVNPNDTQKNWLGFMHEGELHYIYNFSPFRVCDAAGRVKVDAPTKGFSLKEYRGSAAPVPWLSLSASSVSSVSSASSAEEEKEAYICVMHKVYIGDDGRRYYHRFMTLDSKLRPSRVSCFVRFTKERVEYWSGMCPSIRGDSYWITYGTRDSEAYISEMTNDVIESLLMYNLKTGAVKPTVERLAVIG